jgi:hypothetical protein
MQDYRVVKCWGSHIVQTIGSQMAVRLLALRAHRALFIIMVIIACLTFWYSADLFHTLIYAILNFECSISLLFQKSGSVFFIHIVLIPQWHTTVQPVILSLFNIISVHSGQSSWLHNGDVLCFLWGTNWIYICYVDKRYRCRYYTALQQNIFSFAFHYIINYFWNIWVANWLTYKPTNFMESGPSW